MDVILRVVLILGLVVLLRNEIVFRIRMRAIDYIYAQDNWDELRGLLRNPSYDAMVFDLTRWTCKGFYPEFTEKQ